MRCIIRVVDVETTGLDTKNDRPVEIACTDLLVNGDEIRPMMLPRAELCDPGIPIPAVARAVHHIAPSDVAGKISAGILSKRALMNVPTSSNPDAVPLVFAAHNSDFDREILESAAGGSAPWAWIDTCRLARKLWPQLTHYGNQVLRYELFPDEVFVGVPHRALLDVAVTAKILERELREIIQNPTFADVAEAHGRLIAFIAAPIDLSDKKIGFGKHEQLTWREARHTDRGYFQWMIREHHQQEQDTGTGAWDPDQWFTIRKLMGFEL